MPAHRHAKLIMEYANIAMVDDEPWKYFQIKKSSERWGDPCNLDLFDSFDEYRLKPTTFNINGYDIPLPMSEEPLQGEPVYIADIIGNRGSGYREVRYDHTFPWQRYAVLNGLAHETKAAAIQHSHAIISLTRKECGALK